MGNHRKTLDQFYNQPSKSAKTIKFYSLGCKVNQYETQVIREQFERAGFRELNGSQPAKVCVINTCTVTHRADHQSFYLIRRVYRENQGARVIVTGCLTKFDSDKISNIPGVCLIVQNEDKNRIVCLLNNSTDSQQPITENFLGITYFKNHSRAFLKVQDGCDYRCSYCKVAMVRGKSHSRPLAEVIKEAGALARNGYLEMVLSGVCLGSYGKDLIPRLNLVQLIKELQQVQGGFRIRLSSIEANDITQELIHLMAKSDRLCQHLHIPLQSGDEYILRRMNRHYSPRQYLGLIKRIKSFMPEIAITTDAMVGFPGEREENFINTIELIKQIGPLRVHIFPYSRRLNTVAYNLAESVSEGKIKSRLAILQQVSRRLYLDYCERLIPRVREVLAERLVDGYSDVWEGYTDNYIRVRMKSRLNLKNKIIKARLTKVCKDFVLADML